MTAVRAFGSPAPTYWGSPSALALFLIPRITASASSPGRYARIRAAGGPGRGANKQGEAMRDAVLIQVRVPRKRTKRGSTSNWDSRSP